MASAWIAKNMKGKKIAIVHDKTTYGQGLADETKKGLTSIDDLRAKVRAEMDVV